MNQGLRFKTAREYFELNQTEVSEQTGISRNSISKIEGNRVSKPHIDYVLFLRNKGISIDWLIYEKGEMLSESKQNYQNNEELSQAKEQIEELKKENFSIRKELEELKEFVRMQSLWMSRMGGVELGKFKASSSTANLFVSYSAFDEEKTEEKQVA